jgi:hypothetical protein
VAALAFMTGRRSGSLFERFALRAVSVACLLAVVSAAANFSALSVEAGVAEVSLEEYDPVAVLLGD